MAKFVALLFILKFCQIVYLCWLYIIWFNAFHQATCFLHMRKILLRSLGQFQASPNLKTVVRNWFYDGNLFWKIERTCGLLLWFQIYIKFQILLGFLWRPNSLLMSLSYPLGLLKLLLMFVRDNNLEQKYHLRCIESSETSD